MNWYKKAELQYRTLPDLDGVDEDEHDFDVWDAHRGVADIFQERNINPGSQKEYSIVALNDDVPVGGIASGWSDNHDYEGEDVKQFSFDVAAEGGENRTPNSGGTGMMGMRLIQKAIEQYEEEKWEWEDQGYKTMIKVWVVNQRLIPILERRFGFDIEGEHEDGSAHMVRY
tara:strand:- start:15105 stop:15617 length:513 start_codon:yes stop_codon:yes gene_type:complete